MKSTSLIAPLLLTGLLLGCDDIFGSKSDPVTDEIFEAGRQEPGLISEVEYVPLFPFFEVGADGAPFDAPQDVYVGYDEFIYVVDGRGLHVLDLSGRPALFLDIPQGATSVVQDRKLDVYVTARRDTLLNGQTWSLPVVLHYAGLTTGSPRLSNIIWHPFDDDSRKFNRPDPIETDEEVEFTGVGVLNNNRIYVSRRGPINDRTSIILPHNGILEFTVEGQNVQAIGVLDPNRESLRSAIFPTDVTTFVHPPQRNFFGSPDENKELILAQSSDPDGPLGPKPAGAPIRFAVLSIITVLTSDGLEYRPDTDKLTITANDQAGDGFLYDEFRFSHPSDLMFAADGSNYLFVLDAAKDSLFTFTAAGVEGVAPPPGARSSKPVVVSFGGTGDGSRQFRNPQGVGYFNRIVYVADTGNNRLSRFRLNTDFE
ncbi:MAG: hypothetical protein JJ896_16925 [Rhodothermales bacterium]|nr:hypothetical protein [Rhodothermales bacterium]MBO6781343.1 hypothetical protein [Rhodothermales bacterium]